jgi:hypothetical protein
MNNLLKLEEAALFGLSIYLFSLLALQWWWFPLLILAPDIGMVGYAFGAKVGAATYNIFHHRAIAVLVLTLGWYYGSVWVELAGIILFGHCAMDRIFGYGLKYGDSFHHTHLGWIKPPTTNSATEH